MPNETKLRDELPAARHFQKTAVGAMILLALLFAAFSTYDRQTVIRNGEESARQIADHTALITDGTLDTARQILRTVAVLAQPPSVSRIPDPALIRTELIKLKAQNSHLMDLLVIDPAGQIQHWTGNGTPPNIQDRMYFTIHATPQEIGLYVSEPLVSKVHTGQWFFALSEAIRGEQGELRYVLVSIIDVALLQKQLSSQLPIPGSTQALIADNGTVFARNPDPALHVGKKVSRPHELGALSSGKPSATIFSRSQLDNKERIISFHRLKNYPLTAVGTVVMDQLLAGWTQRLLMLAGLWLALSATILWLARRANVVSQTQIKLANIDELTGIRNRRSIMDTASALKRSSANAGTLSLLMIDVDHFKAINDNFGHQAGDQVLRQISKVLRREIRTSDFVGRYGGEEFLVLMPDTGPDGAALVAEKLCQSVAATIAEPTAVTISIGVATTSASDPTLDRTLARADKALYEAKAGGRNCVRVAAPGQQQ